MNIPMAEWIIKYERREENEKREKERRELGKVNAFVEFVVDY
jgi:hypothetical protein